MKYQKTSNEKIFLQIFLFAKKLYFCKMKKYKQTFIPTVHTGVIANNPKSAKEYYAKNLQKKSIVNKHLGFRIYFTSEGKGKLGFGTAIHKKKVAVLQCLLELLEVAELNNFGQRKEKDSSIVLGYLNFKAKVKIDESIETVRIAVTLKVDGKAYYNHEVNKIVLCKK